MRGPIKIKRNKFMRNSGALKYHRGSSVNWLFLNDDEIQAARKVIAEAGANSTVDSLGLGQPVEIISNLLFPGTSTLHSELRYVIFVPSILYAIYNNGGAANTHGLLKKKEAELIPALLASGIKQGIIGRTKGEMLKYRPSTTYWTAVNTYQTLGEDPLDREYLLRSLTLSSLRNHENDDGESIEEEQSYFSPDPDFEKIALPLFKNVKKIEWPEKLSFDLKKAEAGFLINKLEQHHSNSLYVHLLKLSSQKLSSFNSLFDISKTSVKLDNLREHARLYSYFAMGVTYAYRWALCDHLVGEFKDPSVIEEWKTYRDRNGAHFEHWLKKVSWLKSASIENLETAYIFAKGVANERLFDSKSKEFANTCISELRSRSTAASKLNTLKPLLRDRENFLKGNRSKFKDLSVTIPSNIKPKEDSKFELYMYDYRWPWGKDNSLSINKGLRG